MSAAERQLAEQMRQLTQKSDEMHNERITTGDNRPHTRARSGAWSVDSASSSPSPEVPQTVPENNQQV